MNQKTDKKEDTPVDASKERSGEDVGKKSKREEPTYYRGSDPCSAITGMTFIEELHGAFETNAAPKLPWEVTACGIYYCICSRYLGSTSSFVALVC